MRLSNISMYFFKNRKKTVQCYCLHEPTIISRPVRQHTPLIFFKNSDSKVCSWGKTHRRLAKLELKIHRLTDHCVLTALVFRGVVPTTYTVPPNVKGCELIEIRKRTSCIYLFSHAQYAKTKIVK